jgi:CheY-like chemotaxis protein
MSFKILMVEDNESDLETCRSSLKRYIKETGTEIKVIEAKTLDEALACLDNSFDGAIVDLRLDLAGSGDEGTQVVKVIHSEHRIPVAIFTGTPQNADPDFTYIGVYKKGEIEYIDLFNIFFDIYNSGLTKVTGGRGIIEETMTKVFLENILPQWKTWVSYSKTGKNTEQALLRFMINHLMELLDDDGACFPEEMYITPPVSTNIKTGGIVKKRKRSNYFIVLTPACDLVIRRDGLCKTDYVKVCEIDQFEPLRDHVINGVPKKKTQQQKIKELLKNNHSEYYHWLPSGDNFCGGFINFRKGFSVPVKIFNDIFEPPELQVSSQFIKDIVHRFSVFYARQGQPDFFFDELSASFLP